MVDDDGNFISVHAMVNRLLIVVDYVGGGSTIMSMSDMASVKFWAKILKMVSEKGK